MHLIHSFHEILLVDRVVGPLFDDIFHDVAKSNALVMISLDLLFEFLSPCALDVLSENLKLLISFEHLVLELSDLLFERHDQKCFLLILLGGLSEGQQALV